MLEYLKKLYKKEEFVFFAINAFVEDWDEDIFQSDEFENSDERRDIAILREFLNYAEAKLEEK